MRARSSLDSCGQVDDQHVELFVVGRGVSAEPFVTIDVVLEGILDVRGCSMLTLWIRQCG